MGGLVSMTKAHLADLKDKYDEEEFFELVNRKRENYAQESFEHFRDDPDEPKITKARLFDIISSADCFISCDSVKVFEK